MLKDSVAVIDVGSSKITGMIGENGVNENFIIRAYTEMPTFVISTGEIESVEEFSSVIKKVFVSLEESARAKISEVHFSVPANFLAVRNSSQQMYLNKRKKLKKRDVEEYLSAASKPLYVAGYELVDCTGVQYLLDGQKRVTTLTGNVTSSITGMTTFYFAEKTFVKAVRDTLSSIGVKKVKFVPVPVAESLLLFSEKERFAFEVLIDVGCSVTSFSVLYGGGVLYNTSFALGGGYITAYLMQRFNLKSYDLAEKIKRKLNLTVSPDYNGFYEVSDGDNMYRYPQQACNEVARFMISELAEKIDEAIKGCNVRLPSDYNLSLTGGGIAYVRGAKEFLFGAVEIPVNVLCPKTSYMAKPEETSKMAVLNYALNYKGG